MVFFPDIFPCFSQTLPSLWQRWQSGSLQYKAYHYTWLTDGCEFEAETLHNKLECPPLPYGWYLPAEHQHTSHKRAQAHKVSSVPRATRKMLISMERHGLDQVKKHFKAKIFERKNKGLQTLSLEIGFPYTLLHYFPWHRRSPARGAFLQKHCIRDRVSWPMSVCFTLLLRWTPSQNWNDCVVPLRIMEWFGLEGP